MTNKKNFDPFDPRNYEHLPEHERPNFNAGHKKPRTRRELIAQGFMSGGAAIALPSILTILAERQAYGAAEDKCAGAGAAGPFSLPMLVYDFAGGNNMAYSNFLVGTTSDQGAGSGFLPDAAAQVLGVPPANNPANDPNMVNKELGILMNAKSAWLDGFKSSTTATTRALMDGVIFATRSADDSANNPLNPAFWIASAGAKGTLVDIIGSGNSPAKGRSTVPAESQNTASSVAVRTAADATALVNTGVLGQIAAGQEDKILKAAHSMSASRLAKFDEQALPKQIKDLVECGYIKSIENLTQFTPDSVDPTKDVQVIGNGTTPAPLKAQKTTTVFTGVADDANADPTITMAKLVLDGYAGIGTISAAGYDYHGQGRVTQNTKDWQAGRNAGYAFELAARKQKPLVMVLLTDGATASAGGTPVAGLGLDMFSMTSDSGDKSSVIMLVFNPKGKPESTGIRQIGAFNGAGSVDVTTSVGNSIPNMTKAILLNYLALTGKEGDFDKLSKGNPFGADVKKHIAFGKLKT